MRVEITATTPIYRSPEDQGIFIQWVVQNPSVNPITQTVVSRSGSAEGPFETILSNVDSFHFYDSFRQLPIPLAGYRENLNFLSLRRTIYYKVDITDSTGLTATATRVVQASLPKRQALLKRKIQRDEATAFKFNGIQIAVLKRKHWGVRCPVCFDLLTKKVTKSKCSSCYGTGFTGGYFSPVRIRGRFGVNNVQTQITPQGVADVNKKRVVILDYPVVDVYDVLIDVAQNKRYLVDLASGTELRTHVIHQELTVSEIARDSIEYQIAINYDNVPVMY